MKIRTLILICMIVCSGCAVHLGPATGHADGRLECRGVDWVLGDASSCGTEGGEISRPAVELLKAVFMIARSLFPGGFLGSLIGGAPEE